MSYRAPTDEMRFVLDTVVGLDRILALPGFEEVTPDLVDAVLAEAARLAETAIAPLDEEGDRNPPVLGEGGVRTSPAFGRAYAAFRDGGWNAVPFPQAIGGQGLPWSVAFAVQEMWQSASMAFGLCPLLNQAAIELLATHADPALRERFLPRLVSGEWTGTMDLTEPQAGSDLGAIRTLATPRPDGSFALSGGKIFITWGDHDLSSNILHLVLARTPDAPAGSRGLSLFLVPKILPDGRANDLRCIGLERKLGIHGSPTCAMRYGEAEDGATGWLVGVPQGGIAAMFTMMNNARLSVGLQGVAIGDRALQRARAYAAERVQGRGLLAAAGESTLGHPDIRRMLAEMRARIEAGRALTYRAAAMLDIAAHHPDPTTRETAAARRDLLTPIVKAWASEGGVAAASLGIQIHGGAGYIEETGAAHHWRDARIAPIYEGTNGIQAADLAFRKVARDEGAAMRAVLAESAQIVQALTDRPDPAARHLAEGLAPALTALAETTRWIVETAPRAPERVAAGSAAYLELAGLVLGGVQLARAAAAAVDRIAGGDASPFLTRKLATINFYAAVMLPRFQGLAAAVTATHAALPDLPPDAI